MDGEKTRETAECNLRDAGCCDDFIEKYCQCEASERQMCLLEKHRAELLGELHELQKKIDCLDYMIYRIKNAKKADGGV